MQQTDAHAGRCGLLTGSQRIGISTGMDIAETETLA